MSAETSDFRGLSNEEILFLYFRTKEYVDKVNTSLEKKMIATPHETPVGPATKVRVLSDADVEKVKASEYYIIANQVISKLEPVAELISESTEYEKLVETLKS